MQIELFRIQIENVPSKGHSFLFILFVGRATTEVGQN